MSELAPPNPNIPIEPDIIVPGTPPLALLNAHASTPFTQRSGDGYSESYNPGPRPVGFATANDFFAARAPETQAQMPEVTGNKQGRLRGFIGKLAARRSRVAAVEQIAIVPGEETGNSGPSYIEFEPMPKFMSRPHGFFQERSNSMRVLMKNVRDELVFGPDADYKLENAYKAARNIGDSILGTGGSAVTSLLDTTRWYSRPNKFELHHTNAEGSNNLAWNNEGEKSMGLYFDQLIKEGNYLKQELADAGVELHNPNDAWVIALMNTVAHEAGHSMLAGVSDLIKTTYGRDLGLSFREANLATQTFITHNPDKALTGNLITDIKTHEERFAEGYGNMVALAAAEALGYDEAAKKVIASYFVEKTNISSAEAGTHAYDMIGEIDGNKSVKQVGKEKGLDIYAGELGYSIPLTQKEIIEELEALDKMILSNSLTQEALSIEPAAWKELVDLRQSEATKAIIASQLKIRGRAKQTAQ